MNYVKELVSRYEVSKYRIAKIVGVSWNTVNMWHKKVFTPNAKHSAALKALLDEKRSEG